MPQFNLQQFYLDKAVSAITEGIAEFKIREFYAAKGIRINGCVPNPALDTPSKAKFDVLSSVGDKFEVKADRGCWRTGNVFVEHQALSHSESDYYLILAFGMAYVVPTAALRNAVKNTVTVQGGDWLAATGTLLTEAELQSLSIAIV